MEMLPVAPIGSLRKRTSEKWQTYPDDVLPLPVAEMDFALAEPVAAALREAIDRSDTGYPYAIPTLGKALASFAGERWDWDIDPAAVTPVASVEVGVVELLRVLARPGDHIIICSPVYPPFFSWIRDVGSQVHDVPLLEGHLDMAALDRAFATRPAAFLLCSPHNPVGRVHSHAELTEVIRLARLHGVPVISDEIFGPLVLPDSTFTPILTIPGAADVAVSVISGSKTWNLAGLNCASIVASSPRTADIASGIPPRISEGVGHLGVLASVAAYTEGGPWLDRLLVTLIHRRALLGRLLAERLPTVSWRPPEATYLAWLDCSAIGAGDTPWEHFLHNARVATIAGPRFGPSGSGHVRFNFATSVEILDESTAQMARSLS